MVGLIGSSNNPVSGMAIATLIIATLALKATGTTGTKGMVGAIAIGGIICVIAAIFVWRFVPETKGKSLEDMSKLWKK